MSNDYLVVNPDTEGERKLFILSHDSTALENNAEMTPISLEYLYSLWAMSWVIRKVRGGRYLDVAGEYKSLVKSNKGGYIDNCFNFGLSCFSGDNVSELIGDRIAGSLEFPEPVSTFTNLTARSNGTSFDCFVETFVEKQCRIVLIGYAVLPGYGQEATTEGWTYKWLFCEPLHCLNDGVIVPLPKYCLVSDITEF